MKKVFYDVILCRKLDRSYLLPLIKRPEKKKVLAGSRTRAPDQDRVMGKVLYQRRI
jgi:hypothetical protein